MNVIVIPDASMIVIPLIEKNGHTYLSPSNFSKYDNMNICEGNLQYDNVLNTYISSELPSGVKSRLILLSKIIHNADAAIIIGKRPKNREIMYNALNDLILFGGNSCNNAHSLSVKMVQDENIPVLKLAYPTNRSKLIELFDKTNNFLKNLDSIENTVNDDDLGVDLHVKQQQYPISDVKRILDSFI